MKTRRAFIIGAVASTFTAWAARLGARRGNPFGTTAAAPPVGATPPPPKSDSGIAYYTCTMHPFVHAPRPGTCPICGMTLHPVSSKDLAEALVVIDGSRVQSLGIRSSLVAMHDLVKTFRVPAEIATDEDAVREIAPLFGGEVTARHLGPGNIHHVQAGDPLISVFSPELVQAQQEFLTGQGSGIRQMRGDPLRSRLVRLGMSQAQVDSIAKSGHPMINVPLLAPISGETSDVHFKVGSVFTSGQRLLTIIGTDQVIVVAHVHSQDLADVRTGMSAEVSVLGMPGIAMSASVTGIAAAIDPASRTCRVQLRLAKPVSGLRPGMLALATVKISLGHRMAVPVDAVIYSGVHHIVFVDLGGGRMRPMEVEVGERCDELLEIRAGLQVGERVVDRGVFLLASEARVDAGVKTW